MEITGIVLIVGLVIGGIGLLWFIVAMTALVLARRAAKDFNRNFENRRRDFL